MIRGAAVIIAAMLPLAVCAGGVDCEAGSSTRTMEGPQPLVSNLRDAAQSDSVFFAAGTFHSESFVYVGEVSVPTDQKKWHLAYLTTSWGESCRATNRLLVYSGEGAYLGHFSPLEGPPIRIEGAAVIFAPDHDSETRLEFDSDGPPTRVLLDGYVLEFEES